MAAQRDPGRLGPAVPCGLLPFRAGRTAVRGPVRRRCRPQPVAPLGGQAGIADPVPLVPGPDRTAVLAGEHRHQVDVVRAVPDRDPPDRLIVLPVRGQAGPVHHVPGDLRPLRIGQHPVPGRGADRAVPHRFRGPVTAQRVMRPAQQAGKPPEIPAPARPPSRFQLVWVAVGGDDVRVSVLVVSLGVSGSRFGHSRVVPAQGRVR
jgi:hypothetical protein